ncbi:MAG: helix-turn-helix transcriptional regulator [Pseudomonadota bacterium]|nr:helix-turn-helix transcriptional regulator [Pseudomonadota bacterium]|tara:strand:- start:22 stop:348 length:327 start_codon:yes stop_codon:yes gene_type:complete
MQTEIIDRLKECIKMAGSNNALAKKAGISEGTIRRILNGGEPTERTLKTIALSLGISVDWLVTGKGQPNLSGDPLERFVEAFIRAYEQASKTEHKTTRELAEDVYKRM